MGGRFVKTTWKQLPLKVGSTLRLRSLLADRIARRARSWMAASVMNLCMCVCMYVCMYVCRQVGRYVS